MIIFGKQVEAPAFLHFSNLIRNRLNYRTNHQSIHQGKKTTMSRLILIRPGSTDFDDQQRIKGSLDIPLNDRGTHQAEQTADDLENIDIDVIYSAPCMSAQQTSKCVGKKHKAKIKVEDNLRNISRGLWQGKCINELKKNQPRIYKQWQERPDTVTPPNGESLQEAKLRISKCLNKISKRHNGHPIAIVIPEPMASIVAMIATGGPQVDLWQAECKCGTWEQLDWQS